MAESTLGAKGHSGSGAASIQTHTVFDGVNSTRTRLQVLTDRIATLADRMVGERAEKQSDILPELSVSGLFGDVARHNQACGWFFDQANAAIDRIEAQLP